MRREAPPSLLYCVIRPSMAPLQPMTAVSRPALLVSSGDDPNPIRLDDVQEAVWEASEELMSDLAADDRDCLRSPQHLFDRLFDRGKEQWPRPGAFSS